MSIGSFWEAKGGDARRWPPFAGEARADVLIIGAGFTGLATALRLAERGQGQGVMVLEAEEPGFGASGRNNGQVIPTLTRPDPADLVARLGPDRGARFVALVRDSAGLVFDLIRRYGIECDAVQNGWLQPAHTPGRFDRVSRKRFEQWLAAGAPVELHDRQAMRDLLGSDGWFGGWGNPTGGHIDPLAYARGLAVASAGLGVSIHGQSRVTTIERDTSGWRVATAGGVVRAEQVVLATAGYTDRVAEGLRRSVVPYRSYQMASERIGANLRATIVPGNQAVSDTRGDLRFFRWSADGRLVTGGALVSRVNDRERLSRLVAGKLEAAFPALAPLRFAHVWHGDFAVTADRFPRLHSLGPGFWSWIGCNGRGVALATAMGGVMADLVHGKPAAELPLPLDPVSPLPLHGLAAPLSRLMLWHFRWLDSRA